MRIASIALETLFAIASFGPASAEEATFIEKPKVMGSKESTVTIYRANRTTILQVLPSIAAECVLVME